MKKILFLTLLVLTACSVDAYAAIIKGKVTANGQGVAGVEVSDGTQVVTTDKKGRYQITSDKADSIVFISTPSGYRAKHIDAIRPGFWHLLQKAPNKNETHNFILEKEDQSNYTVMFITDCHLVNEKGRDDLNKFKQDVLPALKAKAEEEAKNGVVYTVNLGDFTQDSYWYKNNFNEQDGEKFIAQNGYPTPVYSVCGNHDNDPGINIGEGTDFKAAWCYRHTWGPACYSVNLGNDHWIFMDNIVYVNDGEPTPKWKGVKGNRKNLKVFAPRYLEWLKKDVSKVNPNARIYLCVHAPLIWVSKGQTKYNPQLAELEKIFEKFERVDIFTGHTHTLINNDESPFPRFHQHILPSTSGNLWYESHDMRAITIDGCDRIIATVNWKGEIKFTSMEDSKSVMRIYDMTEVGKYYATDKKCGIYHKLHPERAYYADEKYRNVIYVNYWLLSPEESVEIVENGEVLPVKSVKKMDPLAEITYNISKMKENSKFKKLKKNACTHMFEAKAKTATSPITVNIRNSHGKIIHTKTMERGIPFTPGNLK
ncbi:MAG: calcineurin-like phosphoesterase C-terminal domain-containing protein [Alistipes sp.]|nr:calcineurin-like phosphoesterase C-terminal domain-containing protein [Candidatus Alistipes equi]